ncbi:phosphatidylinositol-4-phosphate 5-kinase [Theileria orientalis strain Shintoku]|uniref:Phosphatidylinositol-4-phosphate 5-kinase n=1 Tax=Theileria orientalis strain Shintoku TaxID=869250 RepID=J4DPR5_THEOR|nr:phosphatidylinositol-4-phosphate 5-kinase [Theileria orientalis strain Shintoku]BAM41164.1 phosphatidylinositol-4-phosphate 5-kinase [Theileria orientalis strain Shintoku]|eukprot:XP_009691465.1 phosphatidylinositol-4-phosphate 5-kinase [Theileria orientalis strain Shintoku]
MGTLCSKPRFAAVTKPTSFLKFTPPEERSLVEQFILEKADHKFVLSAFGTTEPNKWDLEKLSRELKIPVRPLEKLFRANNPEDRVRLPPVLIPDGTVYFGEWKNNVYDGTGHLFLVNGSQYIGGFCNGQFEGPGEMLTLSGDLYKGMYSGGKRHGKGILQFKNGDVYDGSWSYGSRHGYGVERFNDGTVFMGNFKHNKRSGHGELKKSDGTHYEGHFNNNMITGIGKMQWPHGETYTGGFRNGLKHGHGTTTWRSGDFITHKGYYREGKMSGNFKIVKRDGSVQEAFYQNDEFVRNLESDERKPSYSGRFSSRSSHAFSRSSTKLTNDSASKTPPGYKKTAYGRVNHRDSHEFPGAHPVEHNGHPPAHHYANEHGNHSNHGNHGNYGNNGNQISNGSHRSLSSHSDQMSNGGHATNGNQVDQGNQDNHGNQGSHRSHEFEADGDGDHAGSHVPYRKPRFTPRGRHTARPFRARRGSSRYTT